MSSNNALWLNPNDLTQSKYAELLNVLTRHNGVLEHFQIGTNQIRNSQILVWEKSNESCDERQYLRQTRFRTVSPQYVHHFDNVAGSVYFQLQFYRERIEDEVECSIFLKILKAPSNIEFVITEMDIICYCDDDVHRSLMRKQKLSPHGTKKGITVFRSAKINADSLILWKFAIQMEPKRRTTSSLQQTVDWMRKQLRHKDREKIEIQKIHRMEMEQQQGVIEWYKKEMVIQEDKHQREIEEIRMETNELKGQNEKHTLSARIRARELVLSDDDHNFGVGLTPSPGPSPPDRRRQGCGLHVGAGIAAPNRIQSGQQTTNKNTTNTHNIPPLQLQNDNNFGVEDPTDIVTEGQLKGMHHPNSTITLIPKGKPNTGGLTEHHGNLVLNALFMDMDLIIQDISRKMLSHR